MQPQTSSLDDLLAWLTTLPASTDKLEAAADELERVVSIPFLWPGLRLVMKLLIPVCAIGFIARCISVICIWRSGQFWVCRTASGLYTFNAQLLCAISGGILSLLLAAAFVTRLLYDAGDWSPKCAVLFEGLKWPTVLILYWCYCHGILALEMRIARMGSPEEQRYKWRARILNASTAVIPVLLPFTFVALWSTGTLYFARGYDTAQELAASLRSTTLNKTSPELADEGTHTLSEAAKIYNDLHVFKQLSVASIALLTTSSGLFILIVTPFWMAQVRLLLRMIGGVARNIDPTRNGGDSGNPSGTQIVVAMPPSHSPRVLDKSMTLANHSDLEEGELSGQNVPAASPKVRMSATAQADTPPMTCGNFHLDTISLLVLLVSAYGQAIVFTIAGIYTAMHSVHSSRFWNSENLAMAESVLVMGPIINVAVAGVPVLRFFRRRRKPDCVEGPVSATPRPAPSGSDSALSSIRLCSETSGSRSAVPSANLKCYVRA